MSYERTTLSKLLMDIYAVFCGGSILRFYVALLLSQSPVGNLFDRSLFAIYFRYTLFAVVNHIGNLESGHYINYIKQGQSSWFKCDDHLITKSTLEEVLNSEG